MPVIWMRPSPSFARHCASSLKMDLPGSTSTWHSQIAGIDMRRLLWIVAAASLASAAEKGYVNPVRCRPCHAAIYDSYSRTGMARTFRPAGAVPPLDKFVHAPSRRAYQIVNRAGEVNLQRTETGGGNLLERRIDFAIGSGAHSSTYVHRTADGTLIELPVSWYSERGGYWAMSPGYDRPDHSDFRREVTESCLFCHNGYPSEANGGLAQGIDCQRCHGPGEDHVQGGAILNPAKLSPERRIEVCLQCHLESASRTLPDAVRRFGRSTFSYRPTEPLAEWQLYFDFRRTDEDRITVNTSGYGLLRSKCFLNSGGRLGCTTCHDPHRAEPAANTTACRGCHAVAHTPVTTGCTGCHMPKRRTEDAVHVLMTDHYIRRRPGKDDTTALAERHDRQTGPVRLLYPARLEDTAENRLYLAIASSRSSANPGAEIPKLEAAIAEAKPVAPEPFVALGDARRSAGNAKGAVQAYRQAIDRGSREGRVYVAAGELLIQTGQAPEATRLLQSALRDRSRDVAIRNTLAVLSGGAGRFDEAVRLLEEALELNPDEPLTWLNLGVARQALGQKNRAEAAFREAIRLQPEFTRARQYLEALLKN
jgi:tetratricopeptide (TPR) repeat protein